MKRIAVLFALTLTVILVGCSTNKYIILNIQTTPDRFLSAEVTVVGRVVQTMDDRSSEFDYFTISDKSGEIWVMTKRGVPLRGSAYEVQGIFKRPPSNTGVQLGRYVIEERTRTEWDIVVDDYGYETISPPEPVY